jgi:hypothetical protein
VKNAAVGDDQYPSASVVNGVSSNAGGDRVKQGTPIYREPGFCGEREPALLADFKPGLRNLGTEVHEKSAVKLRDF